ncbi:hypothetical protein MLDJOKPK_00097 [Salmonella phage SPAsTU]|nr:hypothetical protein MLDJOKPK_00097 [Salmonella phage SPAsTU]
MITITDNVKESIRQNPEIILVLCDTPETTFLTDDNYIERFKNAVAMYREKAFEEIESVGAFYWSARTTPEEQLAAAKKDQKRMQIFYSEEVAGRPLTAPTLHGMVDEYIERFQSSIDTQKLYSEETRDFIADQFKSIKSRYTDK